MSTPHTTSSRAKGAKNHSTTRAQMKGSAVTELMPAAFSSDPRYEPEPIRTLFNQIEAFAESLHWVRKSKDQESAIPLYFGQY